MPFVGPSRSQAETIKKAYFSIQTDTLLRIGELSGLQLSEIIHEETMSESIFSLGTAQENARRRIFEERFPIPGEVSRLPEPEAERRLLCGGIETTKQTKRDAEQESKRDASGNLSICQPCEHSTDSSKEQHQ